MLKKLRLRLRCLYLKYRYRNELFSIVFYDTIPDIGEILTDANGTQLLIVESGQRDGNAWVSRGYIVHVPTPVSPPTAIPIPELDPSLPVGTPVMMNENMWVKIESGDFVLQFQKEVYNA